MQSGGHGIFAIERHPAAFATLRANLIEGPKQELRYDWPKWLPVSEVGVEEAVDAHLSRIRKLAGHVDLICGGPPCQGYSTNGKRNPDDPRNRLFYQYLRLVREVRPKMLLLENVPGIKMSFRAAAIRRGRRARQVNFANRIVRGLRRVGYKTVAVELDAAEFFVPQVRKRYFIIGVRQDLSKARETLADLANIVSRSKQMLASQLEFPSGYRPTVGHALGDLCGSARRTVPDPEFPKFLALVAARRPSNRYRRALYDTSKAPLADARLPQHSPSTVFRFREIQRLCRPGMTLTAKQRSQLGMKKVRTLVLCATKPAGTVTTLPDDMLHYAEPRVLTVRESARLQSFPDWYRFRGPYTSGGKGRADACPRYTQVGNAVPVYLAQALGYAIQEVLSRVGPPSRR